MNPSGWTKAPWMANMMKPESMPFAGKRIIDGGFEMIVDLSGC
jgi:uncharacterized protein YbaA (DUF1428 family)